MCVLKWQHFHHSSLTFDTISISSQTMTVIIIFTISYFFFFCWNFDYVFSGRSNRFRSRLCPCLGALFKKSTNKIFFYEIFVEFHILWDGKKSDGFQCRWIEITLCCYFGLSPPFIRHSSYEIRGSIRSRPKETNFLKDKTKIYCCR